MIKKNHFIKFLKIFVAITGLWFVVSQVQWEDLAVVGVGVDGVTSGEYTFEKIAGSDMIELSDGKVLAKKNYVIERGAIETLKGAEWGYGLLGLLLLGAVYPVQSFRWWILMRSRGIYVGYLKVLRVWMVGCFMNFCMPGTTGGDLLKAFYAAKGASHKGMGVLTVVVDRVLGLIGLLCVAGFLGLWHLDILMVKWAVIGVGLILVCLILGGVIYFSKGFRKSNVFVWLRSFGFIKKLDRGVIAYRHHRSALFGGFCLSLVIQMMLAFMGAISGKALGIDLEIGLVMSAVPLMMMMGAVPLTYQGFGVMEAVGIALLSFEGGATRNEVIGMLLLMRIYAVIYGLIGGLCLLRGDINLHACETA